MGDFLEESDNFSGVFFSVFPGESSGALPSDSPSSMTISPSEPGESGGRAGPGSSERAFLTAGLVLSLSVSTEDSGNLVCPPFALVWLSRALFRGLEGTPDSAEVGGTAVGAADPEPALAAVVGDDDGFSSHFFISSAIFFWT